MALPRTRSGRRFLAVGALLVLCAASVAAMRGSQKPYAPDSPAYRQKGEPQAPVVIVEFSDFQCPACAAAVEPLKRLDAMHPGKLRIIFKHKPWDFHAHARAAAGAAECAGRQGKFWEMHDRLYAAQASWVVADNVDALVTGYAKEAGLDLPAFEACRKDPSVDAAIAADLKEASDRWINSTPTFFVNGRRFVGGQQLRTQGLKEIERALAGKR